jgi:lipase
MSTASEAPLVLIHGLIGTLDEPLLRSALAGRGQAINLLGYGENSKVPSERITLEAQVKHLHECLLRLQLTHFHLVGHSVGGVVAALLAHQYPDGVLSFINVEGNFTLKDAFMTQKISKMTAVEARDLLQSYRDDPATWLKSKSIASTPAAMHIASLGFNNQDGDTIQAMSASVIETTSLPMYNQLLRDLFASAIPIHLVSGERSRQGWDVPPWALEQATSVTVMSGVGHFMMIERPAEFGQLLKNLTSDVSRM